ncbi:VOC family protein [Duganella qianjiadongensis]|uniref:VOC family protein n=1 Tax=Duganella qianjiadongensis TaxID=2692176 RepID=A0ABW9VLP8_9BURK|nr:VOC family protein [Duganella qianjiadongensis]MYM39398.1 VOC family protein [Duganella qianjiadongensis]
MKRVTGIGGVFFKAKDPVALRAWYKTHLGVDVQAWGGAVFDWTDANGQPVAGATAWTISADNGKEYAPSTSSFMINYRVADLDALLVALRDEGCHVVEVGEPSEFGKFAWVMDPEGNKVELWEPVPGQ